MKEFEFKSGRLIVLYFLLTIACSKENLQSSVLEKIQIPEGFSDIKFPDDNNFTKERWILGKKLFYDKRLSSNNTISCSSCHLPQNAFSDIFAFSKGNDGQLGRSNSPTLGNIAYHPYYTRTGGVPSLEMQVLVPIQEHDEFNHNIVDICEVLSKDKNYQDAAYASYSRNFDPYVLVRAIATFERSMISGNSAYDQFKYQNNSKSLNTKEKKGMELFFSARTQCSSCHSGFNFTNYQFENNGLYTFYRDSGRMKLTKSENDRDLFKVPSLRNVALTGPYMHDGSFNSLDEVIEHYNTGGYPNKNKSSKIKALNLSLQEKSELISFLNSLTDYNFIHNPIFYP